MEDRLVGTVLDGRYAVKEVIGTGGMSVVYKAEDTQEGRLVALKVLKEEFVREPKSRRRFLNESRAIAMLSHENIVDVLDVNFEGDVQYIVMEYLEGPTLKEYMVEHGALDVYDALHIVEQILSALKHAHERGVVHRDIKPQNIILVDGNETVKVMDFGIAHVQNYSTITISDKAIGTVHYISPEQAKGRPADERSDIYSTGVILYEMLTGKLPFDADSAVSVALMQVQQKAVPPSQIVPDIPPAVEHIVMKAMRKNVEARYQNAGEMLEDIEKFKENPDVILETTPPKADPNFVAEDPLPKKKSRYVRKRTQNRWLFAVIGIGGAALLLLVLVLVMLGINNGLKGDYERVPEYKGKLTSELTAEDSQKFSFRFLWQDSDEDEGKIIDQDPPAGKSVEKGSEIVLYVSNGNSPYTTVPEGLTGVHVDTAKSILNALGIAYEIQYTSESADIENDYVVATSPSAGEKFDRNGKIILYLNKKGGSASEDVAIPTNIIGENLDTAKKILDALGIKYVVQYGSSNLAEGLVTKTSPEPGEKVAKGTTITIFVSNGQGQTEPPTTEPTTESEVPTTTETEPTEDPNPEHGGNQ
mgnify:FL=1